MEEWLQLTQGDVPDDEADSLPGLGSDWLETQEVPGVGGRDREN